MKPNINKILFVWTFNENIYFIWQQIQGLTRHALYAVTFYATFRIFILVLKTLHRIKMIEHLPDILLAIWRSAVNIHYPCLY